MLRPIGEIESELRFRAHLMVSRIENHLTNLSADGSSTRLARQQAEVAFLLETSGEEAGLRRFPAAFDAFESNEQRRVDQTAAPASMAT